MDKFPDAKKEVKRKLRMYGGSPGTVLIKNGGEAAGTSLNLSQSLSELESSISADEEGLQEMQRHLQFLKKEREKLKQDLHKLEGFVGSMASEGSLGGVMEQFNSMEEFLHKQYSQARRKHKDAISILKQEFSYHPQFKKGGKSYEFTATYFTPKSNPKKL